MHVLQSPRVWLDAATQILFSLSLAFGGHITFASYNPPREGRAGGREPGFRETHHAFLCRDLLPGTEGDLV